MMNQEPACKQVIEPIVQILYERRNFYSSQKKEGKPILSESDFSSSSSQHDDFIIINDEEMASELREMIAEETKQGKDLKFCRATAQERGVMEKLGNYSKFTLVPYFSNVQKNFEQVIGEVKCKKEEALMSKKRALIENHLFIRDDGVIYIRKNKTAKSLLFSFLTDNNNTDSFFTNVEVFFTIGEYVCHCIKAKKKVKQDASLLLSLPGFWKERFSKREKIKFIVTVFKQQQQQQEQLEAKEKLKSLIDFVTYALPYCLSADFAFTLCNTQAAAHGHRWEKRRSFFSLFLSTLRDAQVREASQQLIEEEEKEKKKKKTKKKKPGVNSSSVVEEKKVEKEIVETEDDNNDVDSFYSSFRSFDVSLYGENASTMEEEEELESNSGENPREQEVERLTKELNKIRLQNVNLKKEMEQIRQSSKGGGDESFLQRRLSVDNNKPSIHFHNNSSNNHYVASSTLQPHEWHGREQMFFSSPFEREVVKSNVKRERATHSNEKIESGFTMNMSDVSLGKLGEDMQAFANFCSLQKQTREASEKKLFDLIFFVIVNIWPRGRLRKYGSCVTGLTLPGSDMDLVVLLPRVTIMNNKEEVGPLEGQNKNFQAILFSALQRCDFINQETLKMISHGSVPIIMLKSKGLEVDISVDISFQSEAHRGIATNKLVTTLLRENVFLRPLVLVLKQFLFERGLGKGFSGGLSSYALVIMCNCFLSSISHLLVSLPSVKVQLGTILVWFLNFYGEQFNPREIGVSGTTFFQRRKLNDVVVYNNNLSSNSSSYSTSNTSSISSTSAHHHHYHHHQRRRSFRLLEGSGSERELMRRIDNSFDPLLIEDPLDINNNVGRNVFRIHQIQRAWADCAAQLLTGGLKILVAINF